MQFELTDDQKSTQEWAKKFAEEVVRPHVPSMNTGMIPQELLAELSSNGFMTLMLPESFGGAGLDAQSFSLVITEIAKVCASTSISIAVTNMVAERVFNDGSDFHRKEFLSQLIDGRSKTASFCLTENGSGSDAAALKTTATESGGKYVLNGEKIYVTNGAFSNFFLVMAKTSEEKKAAKGVTAFLVHRDQTGITIGKEEEKMGLTGSSTLRMSFENVEVPKEAIVLGLGEGFTIAMKALDGGRISVASQALGTAKAALAEGVRYANEREQFDKPISAFQAIQWKIANAATELAAAELLIHRAAWMKDQVLSFTREASMAKLFTTEMAIRLCNEMIQIHGGYGYIKEYPVERYYRDVRVTALYEGTSEIQRLVIARDLLKEGL